MNQSHVDRASLRLLFICNHSHIHAIIFAFRSHQQFHAFVDDHSDHPFQIDKTKGEVVKTEDKTARMLATAGHGVMSMDERQTDDDAAAKRTNPRLFAFSL